nr:putative aldehyde dehydrogenase [Raoultella sp. NCTC 9187]
MATRWPATLWCAKFRLPRHQHRTSFGARGGGKADPGVAGAWRQIADYRAGRCRCEQAARGICYGIFSSGGQACIAGSRLFVHEKVYPQLMARLLELTRGLRIGHPFSADTHVGPLINEKHRDSVLEYVELAKREGGRVLCGGEIPADPALAAGSYFQPTIVEGLTNAARACRRRSSARCWWR